MSWTLFIWLLMLILQAGLLGRYLYALLCLADLEQDYMNPFEATARLNRFVMVELGAQIACLVVLTLGGKWFMALIHAAITAYLVHRHMKKEVYLDATDAFKQMKNQSKWRSVMFGSYCVSFVIIIYRVIETVIHTVLTPEGREIAKRIMREAGGHHLHY